MSSLRCPFKHPSIDINGRCTFKALRLAAVTKQTEKSNRVLGLLNIKRMGSEEEPTKKTEEQLEKQQEKGRTGISGSKRNKAFP